MTALSEIKKLCWNCNGSVSMTTASCPYCGVDLEQTENTASYHVEGGSTCVKEENSQRNRSFRASLLPMLLLIPGGIFFVFSLALACFSVQGTLTLRWNAGYWYLYLLASLPMMVVGWRLVNRR